MLVFGTINLSLGLRPLETGLHRDDRVVAQHTSSLARYSGLDKSAETRHVAQNRQMGRNRAKSSTDFLNVPALFLSQRAHSITNLYIVYCHKRLCL